MPFINSKVSVSMTQQQEIELKTRLGQAISLIPGKSENWLMTGFEDNYHLYFRGDNSEPMAFIEVKVFGQENPAAFEKLTAEIMNIFNEVLGIAPDHIYIKYEAVANWGWNGGNF
ncbi:MAG: phenylpyruvate tautomerase MIF-related protein [Lachnospiraceae bacterium]|nr:phenylpyruvate tautomerase MIF-related protein [Agathobacter sp.]MDD6290982.1 phenylpyruvate tautomerase MIF-related protein [Lachnospiraceae bacterium]